METFYKQKPIKISIDTLDDNLQDKLKITPEPALTKIKISINIKQLWTNFIKLF